MAESSAFTTVFSGRTGILFNRVGISHVQEQGKSPEILQASAIWDTGANGSCITPLVVKRLGLKAYQKRKVHTAAGEAIQDLYLVCIHLPNGVSVNVQATEIPGLSGDFEALIGMNIIGLGDFGVSNYQGRTQMSFRIPSMEHVDYAVS